MTASIEDAAILDRIYILYHIQTITVWVNEVFRDVISLKLELGTVASRHKEDHKRYKSQSVGDDTKNEAPSRGPVVLFDLNSVDNQADQVADS